uniref:organic cation transporter protein-like isoform X2 n=1 Tax=Ciona intestinalis TaxID=7719 RepID=UPI000EF49431|nr:organic cation transporter protein-like isoform X2 [Ciona intestinalis]|eukprot:XP_026693822.1 organic cation transporter protein-like isoform X2 [Ciona intestinalis]
MQGYMRMDKKTKDLDDLQEQLGGFTRYQILVCIGAAYLSYATAYIHQSGIYLSAVPVFRCAVPPLEDPTYGLSEAEIRNYTIPYDYEKQKYDTCHRYDLNLTNCYVNLTCIQPTNDVIPCDKGYHYDTDVYTMTTVTQWNLVCDRSILDTIANSLFFVGFFIGSAAYGPVGDWLGRKLAMLVFCVCHLIFGISLCFSPYFELYLCLRVLSAGSAIACFISVFVYTSEICPKHHRTVVGMFVFQSANIAHATLPGFAYALRTWSNLMFITGLISVPFILIWFILPESPRWLLSVGRSDAARQIMEKYAQSNSLHVRDEDWEMVVQDEKEKQRNAMESEKYSVIELFKRPLMRIISLAVVFGWFTANLVFYGLALNVGSLSGDPYTNAGINGAIEIVGTALILFAPWTGKRNLLCASFLFCSISCFASTVCVEFANGNQALETTSVVLAVMGKMGATSVFTIIYSLTSDIYPTVVRATGVGMGSMAARVGGVVTPFTLELQNSIPWLIQTIFGILSVFAFMTSLFFPETEKAVCLTSLDEAEIFYRQNMTLLNYITRSRDTVKYANGIKGTRITKL